MTNWVTLALIIVGLWTVLALGFVFTSNFRAKELAKAFAWRIPICLVLIHVGRLLTDWAVASTPLHASLARNMLSLVVVLVAGLVFVQPFIKAKADASE